MAYVYADEPGLTSSVTCHDDTILVFQGNDWSTSHVRIPIDVKQWQEYVNG
jgi:hypothetical protein